MEESVVGLESRERDRKLRSGEFFAEAPCSLRSWQKSVSLVNPTRIPEFYHNPQRSVKWERIPLS